MSLHFFLCVCVFFFFNVPMFWIFSKTLVSHFTELINKDSINNLVKFKSSRDKNLKMMTSPLS